MQRVDTTGVSPLRSIRDETNEAIAESEATVERLSGAFALEDGVGRLFRRVRRRTVEDDKEMGKGKEERERENADGNGNGNWDPLALAGRTAGRFFVVDRKVVPRKQPASDEET